MNMTPEQMRELDAWIGRNVFGKKVCECFPHLWERRGTEGDSELYCTHCNAYLSDVRLVTYTTSPADAFAVLEKCAEKKSIEINRLVSGRWYITTLHMDVEPQSTLPVAICLFAKALFGKADQ